MSPSPSSVSVAAAWSSVPTAQIGPYSTASASASESDLLALVDHQQSSEEIKISVKERTQRFNKMASEVDLQRGNNSGAGESLGRREHKPKVNPPPTKKNK